MKIIPLGQGMSDLTGRLSQHAANVNPLVIPKTVPFDDLRSVYLGPVLGASSPPLLLPLLRRQRSLEPP